MVAKCPRIQGGRQDHLGRRRLRGRDQRDVVDRHGRNLERAHRFGCGCVHSLWQAEIHLRVADHCAQATAPPNPQLGPTGLSIPMYHQIRDTRVWQRGLLFLSGAVLAAMLLPTCATTCGCVDSGAGTGAIATGGHATGGQGGAGGTAHASLTLPPAPPTNHGPQPSASVTSPNLRVLPWAGFKAPLTYTFADSQPSHIEHWPELKATGVPMTFFLNPSANWQAGYDADWTAVGSAGCELANHTWNHCRADLSGCTPVGTQGDEIDQSTAYITSHLGAKAVPGRCPITFRRAESCA